MQTFEEHKATFNEIFSSNLKRYMNIYRLTQTDLAKRLKVSPQAVSYWCSGDKAPKIEKIDAMCTIFHCKRSDLMEEQLELHDFDSNIPSRNNNKPLNYDVLIALEVNKMSETKQRELFNFARFLNSEEYNGGEY